MIDILSWHSMNKTIWDSKYITVVVGGGGGGGGKGGGQDEIPEFIQLA